MLKPIVGMVLGALVGAFLIGLAVSESLLNVRGMLDDVFGLVLQVGLASVDVLEKAINTQGRFDDVLRPIRAMFDGYLHYKEPMSAACASSKAYDTTGSATARGETTKEPEEARTHQPPDRQHASGEDVVHEPASQRGQNDQTQTR
jgi:hypothetical protein